MKHVCRKTRLAAVVVLFMGWALAFGGEEALKGRIEDVTVFRGQALVHRVVEVGGSSQMGEVVIGQLPHRIVAESLYAQASAGAKVLSVQYRERAVREDTRDDIKELDEQLAALQRDLKHAERDRGFTKDAFGWYSPFWQVTVDAGEVDFDRALLQSQSLREMTEFLEEKLQRLHERSLTEEDHIDDLKAEIDVLQRRRDQLAGGRSRTEREAVVYLDGGPNQTVTLDVYYLVEGAQWSPKYNLRGRPGEQRLVVEYNAIINQQSGENWDHAQIRLSTAQPTLAATPPELESLTVDLMGGQVISGNMPGMMPQQAAQTSNRFISADEIRQNRRSLAGKGKAVQSELNFFAANTQAYELRNDDDMVMRFQQQLTAHDQIEGVSVSYELPGVLSIPSRSDQQIVSIARIELAAEYTLAATPLLTDYVYLLAEAKNTSETVLLPGPAGVFRDGDFAGRAEVPLVTMGEAFTCGMGIDSQVKATRELDKKDSRVQGGNRIETYTYRLSLHNYHENAVNVRLLERFPYCENPAVKISLGKVSDNLSDEADYVEKEKPKNMLRWDLELKPGAKDVTYAFTMEYDKNMQVQPVNTQQ